MQVSQKKYEKKVSKQENVVNNKKGESKIVEDKPTPELVISKNSVGYGKVKIDPKSNWHIFELAEDITFKDHTDILEHHINQMFKDTEYFVPFFKEKIADKVVSLILFEGYFFVRSVPNISVFPDRYRNEYIKGPMRKKQTLVGIPGIKIIELRQELLLKLKERIPKKKQIVIPKIGIFSNLEGEVIDVDKKNLIAIVKFEYSTRTVEAPISFINLTIKT